MALLQRLVRHFCFPSWRRGQVLPAATLDALTQQIAASETGHRGELRLAVEARLPLQELLTGMTPQQRALEVFSDLRVWDTEENSGVLIYLLLADRRLEIVADRGIHRLVGPETWREIAASMEGAFRGGRFAEGLREGLSRIDALLVAHFPASGDNPNELPDRPVML